MDCSPFLNWSQDQPQSEHDKAVIFRSLIATVKLQPTPDNSLEAKAVKFLKSVAIQNRESTDAFLRSLASNSAESLTNFVQSIMVLVSSPNQTIATAAMEMLKTLIFGCSAEVRFPLVKADLIPQLIITLNPQSLSFTEPVDIHTYLLRIIWNSIWLATPFGLEQLAIEDVYELQTVHETVLKQVIVPSEKYIWHLCVNRFSIIDGDQSKELMDLLSHLLRICPSYQPTMEFVLHMPVVLTIPSCLTFFENDSSIFWFLIGMSTSQDEWNKKRGEVRQLWKTVIRMLRMEGIEDVIEKKMRNDKNTIKGRLIIVSSITWNNLLGMNLPEQI
ncbi:hypothetical protein BLNAU_12058 [Blattamonas nauphoetae]|uniref:Uncharacterized protein n=1 Tax=Blattamonas nauphoetae TaxID=2049346 RepID=A0ABQ9XNH3_9EUKA|nr:hypothetical protein BLNAU_12058 [Blattamonas nauphoetae]